MGLDSVELVMAFEERFAISISDEDAEKIVTVRDAIDCIYTHVQHADSKICLSQRAFYRLRRALQQELGLERKAVRLATPLQEIVPLSERRSAWDRIKRAVGLARWPELERSREVVLGCGAASIVVGALTYAANPPLAAGVAALAAAGSAIALSKATRHLRLHFNTPQTVGQLTEYLVAQDPAGLRPPDQPGWSREQVRTIVRAIIVDQLNVEPTFSDDARFVDDLGVD